MVLEMFVNESMELGVKTSCPKYVLSLSQGSVFQGGSDS